jgi:hypothetical protein
LLVPLRGPNSAMGLRITAPTTNPATIAVNPCQNDNPNRIGNDPRNAVAKVLAPPKVSRNRSSGLASRSASGMRSMPCRSTVVIDAGLTAPSRRSGVVMAAAPSRGDDAMPHRIRRW